MRFTPYLTLLLALIAATTSATGVARAQNSPEAQRVISRARAASGGNGWNTVRGLHETGQTTDGRYERWVDPIRYGDRIETRTQAGLFTQGYNGAYEWRILTNEAVTGSTDAVMNRKVRTDAFFAAYAYFFPSRFDLRSTHLGEREAKGRRYEVLRVQPAGGFPRDLWFDRQTGLLGMIVDENGGKRTTTEFSDYRKAGPVKIAFLAVTTGGDLTASQQRKVEKIEFGPIDRNTFTLSPERVHRGETPPAPKPAAPPMPTAKVNGK